MAKNSSEFSVESVAKRLGVDRRTLGGLVLGWIQELDLKTVRFLVVEEHHSAKSLAERLKVDESTAYDILDEVQGKVHLGRKCKRTPASKINAFLEKRTV